MATFTTGELEVMQVLWEHGEMKPADIQKRFPRPIRNAALRSALLVLLEKGHVTRRKEGKAYWYRAATLRKKSFKAMARRMADAFYGGSSAALIAGLIESEQLSQEDIEYLKEVAEAKNAKKNPNQRG